MSLLEVSDLSFGYSSRPLFEKVTFRLNAGERAALVAPNGAGKSTLLRLIAGEASPDRGNVVVQKEKSVGYYRQSHETKATGSVLHALLEGFAELLDARHELARAQHQAQSGAPEDLDRLAQAIDRHQRAGADRLEHRVEVIATRLGFAPDDLGRDVGTLSGGERGRLALGSVLAREPDLLLLDEPTNHLDLQSIAWLERHLLEHGSTLLIVSHDRAFLDNTCPITLELGERGLKSYPLSYTPYQEARAEDLLRERRLAEEQQGLVEKTEEFIRKNLAGQKTKQAQSRRRMLAKLERLERPEDVWARADRVRFRFTEVPRSGDIVLEATGLAATRGGRTLFRGIDLLLRRGDRLGVIGPNGSGKSTLLKLLAGLGPPEDQGDVRRGTRLQEGYFDQHLGSLDPEKTGVDEIRSIKGELNVDAARQYLARFRFYGDDALRQVASLSGGERTRLCMAKLLLMPKNLLFLDEPTNHLDIPACEILEEALSGFEGTAIVVSHDRRFLETVTTRTLSLSDGAVDVYDGGFRDYCEALERARRHAEEQAVAPRDEPRGDAEPARADAHRARQAAARELERKKRRAQDLEARIARIEAELVHCRTELKTADGSDWERLHELASQEQTLSKLVGELTAEWVKLSDQLEAAGARG